MEDYEEKDCAEIFPQLLVKLISKAEKRGKLNCKICYSVSGMIKDGEMLYTRDLRPV